MELDPKFVFPKIYENLIYAAICSYNVQHAGPLQQRLKFMEENIILIYQRNTLWI